MEASGHFINLHDSSCVSHGVYGSATGTHTDRALFPHDFAACLLIASALHGGQTRRHTHNGKKSIFRLYPQPYISSCIRMHPRGVLAGFSTAKSAAETSESATSDTISEYASAMCLDRRPTIRKKTLCEQKQLSHRSWPALTVTMY